MNLDFLAFHNYYDRVIEKFNTRYDYSAYRLISKTDIDFNPNDGITTEVILEDFSNVLSTEPDYMLVWYTYGTDPSGVIQSRWYIMESKRLRGGQWRLTLRRDVIADYYNIVLNAPCFVEKGNLQYNDPLIFNDEGLLFNQIKKAEYPIKDKTLCPWLVAYVALFDNSNNDVDLKGEVKRYVPVYETINTTFANWTLYNRFNNKVNYDLDYINALVPAYDCLTTAGSSPLPSGYRIKKDGTIESLVSIGTQNDFPNGKPDIRFTNQTTMSSALAKDFFAKRLKENTSAVVTNAQKRTLVESTFIHSSQQVISHSDFTECLPWNGRIIKDTAGKYYKLDVTTFTLSPTWASDVGATAYRAIDVPNTSAIYTAINLQITQEKTDDNIELTTGSGCSSNYNVKLVSDTGLMVGLFGYTEITDEYEVNELKSLYYNTHWHLTTADAPYNVIAMPYTDGDIYIGGVYRIGRTSKEACMQTILHMASNSLVYDVQLLPYCPLQDDKIIGMPIPGYEKILFPAWQYGSTSEIVHDSNWSPIFVDNGGGNGSGTEHRPTRDEVRGIIVNCPYSSFRFSIDATNAEPIETDIVERKVKALTRFTRLCSPNYDGIFEFNKQKNNGLAYYDVNCTYKPFNPYIHINPNFGGLYGSDYDDSRGLICGGNFSLPIIQDAWREYQLQNKNYQNIFDRQIQNMETLYDITNKLTNVNIVGGMIQGAGAGAAAGAMVGGGYGAAAGAVLGAGVSAVGGYFDYKYQKEQQAETLDYTKDVFLMNLLNIKALPNTLGRVGTYDVDNKIFPFAEEYECTPQEEAALRLKVRYAGMTIGRIGTLSEYHMEPSTSDSKVFVQGRLILVKDQAPGSPIHMDTHLATEIYHEVLKGLRI